MKNGGLLQINIQKVKGNIIIDIIDSGIGMSSQQIKQLLCHSIQQQKKELGLVL